jgi:WD40 repeat protein
VVWSVCVSADGRYVISGSYDTTVRVWDMSSWECVHVLEGHSDEVTSVNVSADGRYVISGSANKTVRVWDMSSWECVHVLEGHSNVVTCVCVSADGRYVISGSDDKTVRMFHLEHGVIAFRSGPGLLCVYGATIDGVVGLSPDNRKLLAQRGVVG